MMSDTNALSAWTEGHPEVQVPLRTADRLVVPSIVPGEYYFGICQSRYRHRVTAGVYAEVRLELKRAGSPIPPNDAWIAVPARQYALPVLRNDAHFDLVEGLTRIAF